MERVTAELIEQPETYIPETWKVPKITRPGMFFRPAATHRCCAMEQLDQILARSIATFKELSLKVTYQDSPVRACCYTMEQVEFTVNLWEHRNNQKELMVEIQRTSGDSEIFYRYARSIFAALFDGASTERDGVALAPCFSSHHTSNLMRLFEHQSEEATQDVLAIVVNSLSSHTFSEKLMALQTLATLVNPTTTLPSSAKEVAKAVLLGEGSSMALNGNRIGHDFIQKQLMCLVISRRWLNETKDGNRCLVDKAQYLALEILANGVQLLENSQEMNRLTGASNGSLLIQSLGERIKNAATEPHEACLAARVLCCIDRLQPTVVRTRLGIQEVRVAETIGRDSHAALEVESQKLRFALEVA
ncbi:hypothetical protein FisN_1Lh155 [Fistulifera solaris]|uniref:Uncharacterized protein n=1 Tax=Fistulifera solaris TaxID=1519565 RepID=A0A1Z5K4X9_FISSO|nr:hypothetical protein FisN_1Lh155 [Fistulifera solaris]|eukprot:GAX21320.1 hypothetical protein FisN_1Lh155 [Fistulifera solaris]